MTKPRSLKTLLDPKPVAETLPLQLRAAAGRAVVCSLLLFAPIVASFALIPGNDFGVGTMTWASPEEGAAAIAEEAVEVDRGLEIVERRGCWTEEPPADQVGKIPGGVVMTLDGGRVRYFGDDEHVGQALDHLFASPDPQVERVVGFCR